MADFDDSEFFHSSEFQEHPDQATLKFLRGGYTRLVDTTTDLSNRVGSVESTMVAIQRTLLQISNQLGKRPIEVEPYHHSPPVTHSDPYARNEFNHLPLDNRKSSLRKIEMPQFDGYNASDWLPKVERFFSVRRYSDLDKLDLVALSLEGDVLIWFDREMTRCEFHSWEEFQRRLFLRFGTAPEEAPGNRRFAIKQKETVSAYVTKFEGLSAQVIEQQTVHKEESITHLQVLVSKLDHSLQIHNESPNVCENYQALVGCDELGKEENMFSGLSQTCQVWEPGGVLANHVLVNWFMDFTGYDGIVDGIRCLGIGVCSGITPPIDSRRASRVWERGGLDISAGLTDWLMKCYKGFEFSRLMRKLHQIDLQWVRRKDLAELCVGHGLLVFPWNLLLLEFFLFIHLEDKVCLSGASNRWYGWMVFDRGKNNIISGDVITLKFLDLKKCFFHGAEKRDVQTMLLVKAKDAHLDSLIVRIKVILSCGVALEKQIQWIEIQKLSLYKEMVADPVAQAVLNLVTNAARFGFV